MNQIIIDKIVIGEGCPAATIAEAAVEHLGSLEIAKQMVDSAKEAGADFIKFQLHLPDKEMLPNVIKFWGGSLDEVLKKNNLSLDEHAVLKEHCEKVGIAYLCTPFCIEAADMLDDLGVSAFKIGSGEMTNLRMLEHIAKKGKPIIVSTGMSNLDEIDRTVELLRGLDATFMLTNCTSIYPPRYDQVNLGLIQKFKERYNVQVGHSDHTPDIYTSLAAVSLGSSLIEKHFTISRKIKGPDYQVSIEPEDFRNMVDGIRKIEAAMGAEKRVHAEEEIVRGWAHHSIVSIIDIEPDERITIDKISLKRPGNGIPSVNINEVLGRVAKRLIKKNTQISWDDLC